MVKGLFLCACLLLSGSAYGQFTGGPGDGYAMAEAEGIVPHPAPQGKRLLPKPILMESQKLILESGYLPEYTFFELAVYDVLGKALITWHGYAGSRFEFKLPDVAQGMYLAEVRWGEERVVEKLLYLKP